jgi:hypothetical protein
MAFAASGCQVTIISMEPQTSLSPVPKIDSYGSSEVIDRSRTKASNLRPETTRMLVGGLLFYADSPHKSSTRICADRMRNTIVSGYTVA